jgi:hypothetical protein
MSGLPILSDTVTYTLGPIKIPFIGPALSDSLDFIGLPALVATLAATCKSIRGGGADCKQIPGILFARGPEACYTLSMETGFQVGYLLLVLAACLTAWRDGGGDNGRQ